MSTYYFYQQGLPLEPEKLIDAAKDKLNSEWKVVLRPDESSKKFSVIPLRWIVERSFAWLENCRRIAMDYEFYADTGVAMLQMAFIRIMLNKIIDITLLSH